MEKLRKFLASKPAAAFAIAVLIGIVLSYLHDIIQLISIPVGEWARVTFIVNASNEFLATNLVNFLFQLVTFSFAYALALALMAMLISLKTMFYPSVVFITHLVLSLWWVPLGFIIGFQPTLKAALPLLPTFVIASVVVFLLFASFVVRKHAATQA